MSSGISGIGSTESIQATQTSAQGTKKKHHHKKQAVTQQQQTQTPLPATAKKSWTA